jgi:hypothetical protein
MSEETADPDTMTSNCAARRNSSGTAEFDLEGWGAQNQGASILMREIVLSLAAAAIATAGSTLSASAMHRAGAGGARAGGNGRHISGAYGWASPASHGYGMCWTRERTPYGERSRWVCGAHYGRHMINRRGP